MTFEYKETWLHKINPSVKLLTMVFLMLFVIFIHNVNIMLLYTVITFILFLCFTGHPYKRIILLSIPFLIVFMSTASTMIFFGKGEKTLFIWGLVHITEESLFRGLHLGFRALIYATLGLLFALTTRPVYLFYSLMQQLKLKPKYAYSFMAAIRLVPIMLEEFVTIRYAQKVRGIGATSILQQFKRLSIPLLSQCIRRAYRIAVAMEAKRFDHSTGRTFYYQLGYSRYDLIFIAYFVVLFGIGYLLGILYPFFSITDVRYLG